MTSPLAVAKGRTAIAAHGRFTYHRVHLPEIYRAGMTASPIRRMGTSVRKAAGSLAGEPSEAERCHEQPGRVGRTRTTR